VDANKFFVIVVVFENPLKIFDLTDNFKVGFKIIKGLKHIVNVGKTFDFDVIVKFIEIFLELAVFGNFVMNPEIWNFLDEVLLKLFGFCQEINLKFFIILNIRQISFLVIPISISSSSRPHVVHVNFN
jgi:hypothetical protein